MAGPRRPSAGQEETPGAERLQKILAHAGVGSRRACEELILQGRVTVGGKIIRELGTKVDPTITPVAVDGQKVQSERLVYFAVYKPKGYVSTNDDPSGRPRVLDILPEIPQRVYTVGRLDEMSVGLMLLTNDGELANKLAHPRFGVEKLYRVVVAGSPTREVLGQLTEGIWLAEGKVRAKSVRAVGKRGDSTILELVLAEGKNREVRRMLAKLGHKVMTLTRVAVGPITIKGLTAGQFRPLTGREVDLLRRVAAGQPVPMPWMDRKPRREPDRPRRPESAGHADRRPGPHSSNESRPGPRGRSGGPGVPPRPVDGPRLGPGGMPGHSDRPGFPPHPGLPPSERPRTARYPGPRPASPPSGYGQGRREQGDNPPRPGGHRPYQNQGPRPGGPRPYQDGPPRPSNRPGGPPNHNQAPRPGGARPYQDGPPRPSNRPGGPAAGQHQGRRNSGDGPPRPPGPRQAFDGPPPRPPGRPGGQRRPAPPDQEPRPRRVIGLGPEKASPPAEPAQVSGRDDRPKPRPKRPTGKRPAHRPGLGSKPMPKPRRTGRGKSD